MKLLLLVFVLLTFSIPAALYGQDLDQMSDAWCAAVLDYQSQHEAETGKGPKYDKLREAYRAYIRRLDDQFYLAYVDMLVRISSAEVPLDTVRRDAQECRAKHEN